jgi:hypothetical protein
MLRILKNQWSRPKRDPPLSRSSRMKVFARIFVGLPQNRSAAETRPHPAGKPWPPRASCVGAGELGLPNWLQDRAGRPTTHDTLCCSGSCATLTGRTCFPKYFNQWTPMDILELINTASSSLSLIVSLFIANKVVAISKNVTQNVSGQNSVAAGRDAHVQR